MHSLNYFITIHRISRSTWRTSGFLFCKKILTCFLVALLVACVADGQEGKVFSFLAHLSGVLRRAGRLPQAILLATHIYHSCLVYINQWTVGDTIIVYVHVQYSYQPRSQGFSVKTRGETRRYNHCVRSRSIFVSIMWRFQSVQPINVELVMLFRLKPSNVLDTKLIEAIDRNRFSDNFADTNNTIRLHTLTLIFLSILSTSCPNVSMICSPWSIKNLSSSSGVWISRTS
jgi:hypothetical protein